MPFQTFSYYYLLIKGIVIGITLDFGPVPLYGGLEDETDTQGLDGLDDKCKKYKVCAIYFLFVISLSSNTAYSLK